VGGLVRAAFDNGADLAPALAWSACVLAAMTGSFAPWLTAHLDKIGAMANNVFSRKDAAMIKTIFHKTTEAAFFAVAFHTIGLDTLSL
jgi:hypothetical protein